MNNQVLDDNPEYRARTKADFARIATLRKGAEGLRKKIKVSRVMLYLLAGLTPVGVLFSFLNDDAHFTEVFIQGMTLMIVYLAVASYSIYNPHVGITLGLLVFLLVQIFYALMDYSILMKGLIFKIAILFFLARGVVAAFELKKINKALFELGERNK